MPACSCGWIADSFEDHLVEADLSVPHDLIEIDNPEHQREDTL
jgi:hypothetical protein